MPTPNYSKSCIYMLRHKDDFELQYIYIGSTTNFKGRKCHHKTCCCNPNNKNHHFKIYQYIRANGGWDNWKMIWIEDYPCKSKKELLKKEDEVMLQYENRLNINRASRTYKEYYEDNKERLVEEKKEYRNNNKEKIAEKKKKYYENNKEKIAEKKKKYNEDNKEIIAEIKKKYYENNKEKNKEKIKCNICGCESTRSNLTRHQKSKKCQSHLTNS